MDELPILVWLDFILRWLYEDGIRLRQFRFYQENEDGSVKSSSKPEVREFNSTTIHDGVLTANQELITTSFDDIYLILIKKLVEDKYLSIVTQQNDEKYTRYAFTANGMIFHLNGGYQALSRDSNREDLRVRISHILTWTLAAGVTTPFLWYLRELLNKDVELDSFQFWLGILIGLCLTIAILIVWLIGKEIAERKKQ